MIGRHTTADEVLEGLDLSGMRVLVTGAAVGLGREKVLLLNALPNLVPILLMPMLFRLH